MKPIENVTDFLIEVYANALTSSIDGYTQTFVVKDLHDNTLIKMDWYIRFGEIPESLRRNTLIMSRYVTVVDGCPFTALTKFKIWQAHGYPEDWLHESRTFYR